MREHIGQRYLDGSVEHTSQTPGILLIQMEIRMTLRFENAFHIGHAVPQLSAAVISERPILL